MTGLPERCPVCGKPAVSEYRPFCSRRCADVDLGRWFNENYRIPADPSERNEDEDPADEPAREPARELGDESGEGGGKGRRGVLAH